MGGRAKTGPQRDWPDSSCSLTLGFRLPTLCQDFRMPVFSDLGQCEWGNWQDCSFITLQFTVQDSPLFWFGPGGKISTNKPCFYHHHPSILGPSSLFPHISPFSHPPAQLKVRGKKKREVSRGERKVKFRKGRRQLWSRGAGEKEGERGIGARWRGFRRWGRTMC